MATISLDSLDLAALLCSRVCHDVISPVGAIVNGLEVLEDDSDASMRDFALDLIQKSAKQASARLQFARLAFGAAGSAGASIDLGDAEQVGPRSVPRRQDQLFLVLAAAAVPEEPGEASPQPGHDRHHGHPARRLDCGDRRPAATAMFTIVPKLMRDPAIPRRCPDRDGPSMLAPDLFAGMIARAASMRSRSASKADEPATVALQATRTAPRRSARCRHPVRHRSSPEKENAEYGNENDAQLVERRDACRVAEFQGLK